MTPAQMERLIREVIEDDRELGVALRLRRTGIETWYVVAYADGELYEADDVHRWLERLALGRPHRADPVRVRA